jgi:hypothetical protein
MLRTAAKIMGIGENKRKKFYHRFYYGLKDYADSY